MEKQVIIHHDTVEERWETSTSQWLLSAEQTGYQV